MNKKFIVLSITMHFILPLYAAIDTTESKKENFIKRIVQRIFKSTDTTSVPQNNKNTKSDPLLYQGPIGQCGSFDIPNDSSPLCQNTPVTQNEPLDDPIKPVTSELIPEETPEIQSHTTEIPLSDQPSLPTISTINELTSTIENVNESKIKDDAPSGLDSLSVLNSLNAHQPKEEKLYEKTWRESAWEHKGTVAALTVAGGALLYMYNHKK